MPHLNKKGWLAIAFIFFSISIPFAITYYTSTPAYEDRHKNWQQSNAAAAALINSQIATTQVCLLKNDRIQIKNTCLVFKGLEEDQVKLDLYLLELEPKYPYAQCFPTKTNGPPIRLGDTLYTVKSANESLLTLNVLENLTPN